MAVSDTTGGRKATYVGIAVGIVLLGLLALFAIVLPKAADAEDGGAQADLTLPDTLPGGYAAADDPASFKGGQLEQQADAIAEQQAASTKYGNRVLSDVLGTAAATRSYVVDGTKPVFVQVFRSDGGAFAPSTLTDPDSTNGAGGTTMEAVGDGACILNYSTAQPGQSSTTPASSQCQVTQDHLTVQIESNAISAKDLVGVADALLSDLQER